MSKFLWRYHCCGSVPLTNGSGSRIQILLSSSETSKKNPLSPTVLWLLYDFLSLKNDANVPCLQNVIRGKTWKKQVFVGVLTVNGEKAWSGPGFVPKYHGSDTGRHEVFPSGLCSRELYLLISSDMGMYRSSLSNSLFVQVVWAVTDLGSVPKGSVLINPDTGTPYLNRKPDHTANLYWR